MATGHDPRLAEKEAEIFRKFLQGRKVLIVDNNAASRSSIFNVFKELGARPTQLFLANTYQQAEQQIGELKPHVVVAEFELGKHCGLELLQSQREHRGKETKECIFIIVTGNTSQSAAARALEEDIDAYIIKPYTMDFVRRTFLKAALQKIRPPEYIVTIEQGKAFLEQGQFDEAEALFEKATSQDSAPSLAFYYLGQVKFLREVMEQAQSSYMKGLKFNSIHYKCLVGMYELLIKEQRNTEAYDVVRKIAKYFPANPKRLADVLRLAIVTGQYEDIERYYQIFTNMPQRNETLIRYTSAALIICGRYYLSMKQNGKALDILKKAAIASANSHKVLGEIIPTLLEYGLGDESYEFLAKFPPETQKTKEFFVTQLLVSNSKDTASLVIHRGRALLAQGIADPRLYEVMLRRSHEAGLHSAVEDLMREACVKFPDKKVQFEEQLKKMKA